MKTTMGKLYYVDDDMYHDKNDSKLKIGNNVLCLFELPSCVQFNCKSNMASLCDLDTFEWFYTGIGHLGI